jgi:hypothetical protein
MVRLKRKLEETMEKLAEILAEMVRSVLTWEKEHGITPQNSSQNETYKASSTTGVGRRTTGTNT